MANWGFSVKLGHVIYSWFIHSFVNLTISSSPQNWQPDKMWSQFLDRFFAILTIINWIQSVRVFAMSSDRTKVVVRHLPPTITEASLLPLIDSAFASRYNWLSFYPAKIRLVQTLSSFINDNIITEEEEYLYL
jgi:hypothetical protein